MYIPKWLDEPDGQETEEAIDNWDLLLQKETE